MAWPTNRSPFGENRTPALIGLSYEDGATIVPIAADPATGAILTEPGIVASRGTIAYAEYTFTASTSTENVIAAITGKYTDIVSIVLTNSGASPTLFTLSDGTNSYYYYVPSGDMRGAVYGIGSALEATTVHTAWTGVCGTSTSSLYATITYATNV